VLEAIGERLGLAPGAEVTVEANPETVDPASLAALRDGGVTRISLGMQSAAAHVLGILDRVHTPGRAAAAADPTTNLDARPIRGELEHEDPRGRYRWRNG
jgi:oxygen-independent coproporphyrinogen-3 oxidase